MVCGRMCHMCKKNLDLNFKEAVLVKISSFHEVAPNLTPGGGGS